MLWMMHGLLYQADELPLPHRHLQSQPPLLQRITSPPGRAGNRLSFMNALAWCVARTDESAWVHAGRCSHHLHSGTIGSGSGKTSAILTGLAEELGFNDLIIYLSTMPEKRVG